MGFLESSHRIIRLGLCLLAVAVEVERFFSRSMMQLSRGAKSVGYLHVGQKR